LEKDVALYQELFAIRPVVLAHDLHPDYVTTRYAQSARSGREASFPAFSTTMRTWPAAWQNTDFKSR
jgi:hypothetical protein